MKGNIKKLTVLMIIAAMGIFVTNMASAGPTYFHRIIGHYAVTGSGLNFVSTTGFNEKYDPNPCPENGNPPFGCATFQDIQIFSGDLTFKKDGTGHFTQYNRGIDTPPGAFNIKQGDYDFIYTKSSERTFTYQLKPGTYMSVQFTAGGQTGQTAFFEVDGYCEGVLSQDLQNVVVTCGPPNFILTAVDPVSGAKAPIQALLSESIIGILVK